MSTTRLPSLPRPVRPVTLPGGGAVHVRDVTIAELRQIDSHQADGDQVRFALLVATVSLCDQGGNALFADPFDAGAVAEVEQLTPSQLEAVVSAVLPKKADAKNG
jgi:hypothetical protein